MVTPILTAVDQQGFWGLLTQPKTYKDTEIAKWPYWAADNGCFSQGALFDSTKWFEWLMNLAPTCRAQCLFATAPDILGDHFGTVCRSGEWLPAIRAIGYKAAFVSQDGSEEDSCLSVPWNEFDVLFLGGSTEWKLDVNRAGRIVKEALRRHKPVHMGRVNSKKRLQLAKKWGCHSADGTYLAFGPEVNLPKMLKWRT